LTDLYRTGFYKSIYFYFGAAMQSGKIFDQIKIGDWSERRCTITADYINRYAELTDGYNPPHVDDEYAAKRSSRGELRTVRSH
jgi:acyl dehydratase